MPMIDIAHQHLLTARAVHEQRAAKGEAEFSNLDWSALIEGVRASAGLQAFDRIKVNLLSNFEILTILTFFLG